MSTPHPPSPTTFPFPSLPSTPLPLRAPSWPRRPGQAPPPTPARWSRTSGAALPQTRHGAVWSRGVKLVLPVLNRPAGGESTAYVTHVPPRSAARVASRDANASRTKTLRGAVAPPNVSRAAPWGLTPISYPTPPCAVRKPKRGPGTIPGPVFAAPISQHGLEGPSQIMETLHHTSRLSTLIFIILFGICDCVQWPYYLLHLYAVRR